MTHPRAIGGDAFRINVFCRHASLIVLLTLPGPAMAVGSPRPAVVLRTTSPSQERPDAGAVFLIHTPYPTTPGALLTPARLNQKAPARFQVTFTTSKGNFVVLVTRAWAPNGADRLYNLVQAQFFHDMRIHRVIPGVLVQFGLHGDPAVNRAFFPVPIPDDPPKMRNQRGTVALAGVGKNSRRTELIINLENNRPLDEQGVVPLGKVVSGMNVVAKLQPPNHPGTAPPLKRNILTLGSTYMGSLYPKAERISDASLSRPGTAR